MYMITGECPLCGKKTDLIDIGDIEICEECADESYVCCDHCRGYFPKEDTIVYYLKNGEVYCEDCAIYALNFSGMIDDDIDHVYDPEEDEEY